MNYNAFCGHSLGRPLGMMEYWNTGFGGMGLIFK
jgi:hypothetical protein